MTPTKKGGRPKRDLIRFSVFLSPDDLKTMSDIADRESLVTSDIVRRAIREFIERVKK